MPHLQDLGTSGTLPPLPQNCYTPGFFCPKNCSDAGILGNRGTWVNGQTGLEFSGGVNGQTDGKRTNGLRNFLCNYQCHGQRNRGPDVPFSQFLFERDSYSSEYLLIFSIYYLDLFSIYLHTSTSIQPRTSLSKFGGDSIHLLEFNSPHYL